jgi:Domain of unknown function (DUF4136)
MSNTRESVKEDAAQRTKTQGDCLKFTKAIISPATARFGPALVLALVACSVAFAQDVRTNYMPGTDFSKYHTYAWVNDVQGVPAVGGHPDQILDAQLREAIDSQMVAKGFTKAEDGSKADLLLGYQLAIDQGSGDQDWSSRGNDGRLVEAADMRWCGNCGCSGAIDGRSRLDAMNSSPACIRASTSRRRVPVH